MLYFGGKLISIWIWSGQASASMIFNTFLFAQLAQYLPYILFDLTVNYHSPIFRANTTWY